MRCVSIISCAVIAFCRAEPPDCTLIAAMLVLAYKQSNGIKSFKVAKIRFFKELHMEMLEELLENRNGLSWVKKLLRFSRVQRQ